MLDINNKSSYRHIFKKRLKTNGVYKWHYWSTELGLRGEPKLLYGHLTLKRCATGLGQDVFHTCNFCYENGHLNDPRKSEPYLEFPSTADAPGVCICTSYAELRRAIKAKYQTRLNSRLTVPANYYAVSAPASSLYTWEKATKRPISPIYGMEDLICGWVSKRKKRKAAVVELPLSFDKKRATEEKRLPSSPEVRDSNTDDEDDEGKRDTDELRGDRGQPGGEEDLDDDSQPAADEDPGQQLAEESQHPESVAPSGTPNAPHIVSSIEKSTEKVKPTAVRVILFS
ncbi:hypothetical protein DL98DRAFT_578148 [Cadophora sp. DSE1049]|nr:hypothetical protein DL98DRAFT_578148 [Cadophora sp. DSE1049]